jgi:hypothetical protein
MPALISEADQWHPITAARAPELPSASPQDAGVACAVLYAARRAA